MKIPIGRLMGMVLGETDGEFLTGLTGLTGFSGFSGFSGFRRGSA
jgi:hypothetical protein